MKEKGYVIHRSGEGYVGTEGFYVDKISAAHVYTYQEAKNDLLHLGSLYGAPEIIYEVHWEYSK